MCQGNLSVSTTRLLKSILPGNCLWTSLRDVEGLKFQDTIKELKKLHPPSDSDDDEMADNPHGLSSAVPEPIRRMLQHRAAIEALGSMIWYLNTLNIDKDILSMKNFNVYDPMKRGQGLVLDGQTLAHIEVSPITLPARLVLMHRHFFRSCRIVRVRRKVLCSSCSADASRPPVRIVNSHCIHMMVGKLKFKQKQNKAKPSVRSIPKTNR